MRRRGCASRSLERVEALGACALRELAMRGCTTVYDTGIGLLAGAAEHRLLDALARAPEAPVRVRGAFTPELATALGATPGAGDERYDVVGISYRADGSIEDFSAALGEPYLNGRGSGELMREEAELREAMRVWHDAGWQLVVHSEGDRATEQVLRCFEAVLADAVRRARCPTASSALRWSPTSRSPEPRRSGLSVSHAINQVYYLRGKLARSGARARARRAPPLAAARPPARRPQLLPQRRRSRGDGEGSLPRTARAPSRQSIPAWRCALPPPA